MTFSLSQLPRARRLRAMGALAWLMLVLQSLTATPMPMDMAHVSRQHHAVQVATTMAGQSCHPHTTATLPSHCCDERATGCDGLSGHGCTCAAMAGTALPAAALPILRSSTVGMIYAVKQDPGAPAFHLGPPFRPPSA